MLAIALRNSPKGVSIDMTDSQTQLAAPARTSPLAIVALVAGIAGWTFFPVIGGVVAVITGHLARDEIRKSQGRLPPGRRQLE